MDRIADKSGIADPSEWVGTASNGGFLALAAFIVLEGAVLQLILHKHPSGAILLTVVHTLLVIALELQSKIAVHVDQRALTIRYGRLGWLRQHFPMERIVSARATELDPMEAHGGWGYRGSLKLRGKAAVVVRAGSAVRLELRGGKLFDITVDGAENAASLINTFISRRKSDHPPAAVPA
jgi:hypothetical protein